MRRSTEIPEGFPIRLPPAALAGLDGADRLADGRAEGPEGWDGPPGGAGDALLAGEDAASPIRRRRTALELALPDLTLSPEAAHRIREEIARAGGREVCFLATVDAERVVHDARAVARGSFEAVLVAARDAPEGGVMIHNHPDGVLEPSEADMGVAARLYEQGLGTAIVDNAAERIYVIVEPPLPQERVPLDADELAEVVAPGGDLAGIHPGFEDRPSQREMLREIAERFNEGGIAIVEAGTGTGKSLAYLLPAARWAQQNGGRTVVSTNTINLQEQLVGKDLPLVRQLLGDVRWTLVKGRGNYVSIRRAHLAAQGQTSLFEDDRSEELASLLEWIESTDDGSLSDLPFSPSDDTWEEVRSDPDMCLRAKCPHFQQCFYQSARRRAASAELLVVNHHLLFTDLSVRRATNNYTDAAVLPAYQRAILDEAHNLEDAATTHLGVEVTRRGLYRVLSRLERKGRGILAAIHDEVRDAESGRELRVRMENQVRPAHERALASMDALLEHLEPLVGVGGVGAEPAFAAAAAMSPDGAAARTSVPAKGAVRLGPSGIGEPASDPEIDEALTRAVAALGDLEREVAELRARLELDGALAERLQGRILDLRSIERRLASAVHALRLVLAPGEDGAAWVRWLDVRGRARQSNLVLAAAPIELGGVLRESLFTRVESAVLTSATLTTRKRFDFVRGRLGLDREALSDVEEPVEVTERILASPFDFASQTLLAVPTDLPPAEGADPGFHEATADVVRGLAELSGGGIFVLFTSHAALRRVAERLRAAGADRRWPLYVHGEGDRSRLLEGFVRAGDAILLGTASFWEGVDVPGDPLRGLVIQKLPFRVPTEPVTAARMEAIETRGGDPFRSFMLPHAALRLKQGFGRLVRSRTDRGAVLVLDDRLVTRKYGRYLRDSIPETPLVKGPWVEVLSRLKGFYAAR